MTCTEPVSNHSPLGRIAPQVWCIVFRLGSPDSPDGLPEEAAEIIERLVLADVHIETLRSGEEIYVTMGTSQSCANEFGGGGRSRVARQRIRVRVLRPCGALCLAGSLR